MSEERPVSGATRLLRILLVCSIVLPLAVLVIGGYLSWRSVIDGAEIDLRRRVAIAEEHALKVLDTHQLIAARVNDSLGNLPDQSIVLDERVLHEQLKEMIQGLPQIQTVLVIGREGHPLVSATVYPVNHTLNFSDREHFQALRGGDTDQYLMVIDVGRLDSSRHFILSRRKESEPGSFDGVIAVSVSPQYLYAFYAKLVNGNADFTASLFRTDGVPLVRYPSLTSPQGTRGDGLLRAIEGNPQMGLFRAPGGLDRVDRVIAYDKLPGYPVYATVGRTWTSIVAEWRDDMLTHLYFGAPATLGMVALSLLALRRTRREEQALAREREATQRRETAEEALRQSQKMEAVGQLTGGVAHDFNNLLTVVIGNLELALRQLDHWSEASQDRLRHMLASAMRGAQRGATLTQRLLAFSRRQPLSPKPLDLNKLVAGLTDFLQRSIGETIALKTAGAAGLWKVEADPVQLEAALLNLAVNARDAMPDGGTLSVTTSNVYLDEDFCSAESDLKPGHYVRIAVRDTGHGMPPQVIERAFEPFFTTKVAGQGTGLGLSQVFGFVKQSGGHVTLDSAPSKGTTVAIYLPRLYAELREEAAAEDEVRGALPGESVLVVEDDEEVRLYIVEILHGLNYLVFEAADADDALALIARGKMRIDLLLTDVVLPGMNGRQLAAEIAARLDGVRVLYMTGYSRDAIVRHGRVESGVELIQKPFTEAALAARIRDVLDTALERRASPSLTPT